MTVAQSKIQNPKSKMSSAQLRLIHVAARQVGLDDDDYREILRGVAGVRSSKQLGQRGYEMVMAHLEHCGFRQPGKPADYWRARQFRAGVTAGPRQIYEIERLARLAGVEGGAGGVIRKATGGRVDDASMLSFKEARKVIEALKAITSRATSRDREGAGSRSDEATKRRSDEGVTSRDRNEPRASASGAEGYSDFERELRRPVEDSEVPF